VNKTPYAYSSDPDQIVLNGELEFNRKDHPKDIYKKLCKTAEEVGGMVTTNGIRHGGTITVYPCYDPEYYVIHLYEVNEDPETLKAMHIYTWRRVGMLDLMNPVPS